MIRTMKPLLLAGMTVVISSLCAAQAAEIKPVDIGQYDGPNPLGLFIDHASIGVADRKNIAAWYNRVLGFKILDDTSTPEFAVGHVSIPGFRVDFVEEKGSTRPTPKMDFDKQGWLHVVFGVKDAEGVLKRLVALKTDVEPVRDPNGALRSMRLHDIEGNAIQIVPK